MNAQEAIEQSEKTQQSKELEAFALIEKMPDIKPLAEIEPEEDASYESHLRYLLDVQMAHLATNDDDLMKRATICGVIVNRLNQRRNKNGKPSERPVKIKARQVARILMGLVRFAAIGPSESLITVYQYDPTQGIYAERPLTLRDAINHVWPDANRNDRAEVIDRITSLLRPVTESKNPAWVVMNNGVLDINTKQLHPFSPEHIFLSKVAQDWNENATDEPTIGSDGWKLSDALEEYFGGKQDEIRAFWHVCQLALLTNRAAKVFVYFYSRAGQSGKGTMTELLMNLVGQQNAGAANIETLESRFGLADVYNKALIYGNENDSVFSKQGSNNLKMLSTGDGVTVDRKGLPAITVKPTPLIVQSMNNEPNFLDLDGGIRQRLRIFTFEHGYPDSKDENVDVRDKYIKDPRLLQWLAHKVLSMDVPDRMPNFKSSREFTKSLIEDNDTVNAWYNDRMSNFKGSEFPTKLIYADYRVWMCEQGKTKSKTETRRKFVNELKAITSDSYHYDAKHGRAIIAKDTLSDIKHCIETSPIEFYNNTTSFDDAFALDSRQSTFEKIN